MLIEDHAKPTPCIIIGRENDSFKVKPTSLPVHKSAIDLLSSEPIDSTLHIADWSEEITTELYDDHIDEFFRSPALLLKSSLHDVDNSITGFSLPNRHLVTKGTSWKIPSSKFGEVSFHAGYWEWTEHILAFFEYRLVQADIYAAIHASLFTYVVDKNVLQAFFELWHPLTNTLHTAVGELSISLWDLRGISGLPILGDFYDEAIPSAYELLGDQARSSTSSRNDSTLPRCCKYLFLAYHMLPKTSDGVLISDWINFWFKETARYAPPPSRSTKKRTSKPRFSRNPCGSIDASLLPRANYHADPFTILGIEENVKEDTYLAAFLACWLCSFVLPHGQVNRVRATVFKVASQMARGRLFSLAIPVLTSIYRGLRDISTSPNLTESTVVFPIHYLYSWIARYFDTHFTSNIEQQSGDKVKCASMVRHSGEKMAKSFEIQPARDLFHNINSPDLRNLHPKQQDKEVLMDRTCFSLTLKGIFISLRSSYLTFRCGNEHLVEAYSPHRFSRQHGLCQHIPGCLKKEILTCGLSALVRLWRSCTFLNSSSTVVLPGKHDVSSLATKEYIIWWQATWDATQRNNTKIVLKLPQNNMKPNSTMPKQHKGDSSKAARQNDDHEPIAKKLTSHSMASHDSILPAEKEDSSTGDAYQVVERPKKRTTLLYASSSKHEIAKEGNEVISALSCSAEDSDSRRQLKKKQKLSQLEDGARATSAQSGDSVNELTPFDLSKVDSSHPPCGKAKAVRGDSEQQKITLPKLMPKARPTEILETSRKASEVPHRPSTAPEPSVFCLQALYGEAEKMLVNFLWKSIRDKIERTPFETLSKIESDIRAVFGKMKGYMRDPSPLEKRLKEFLENASNFASVKQNSIHRQTQEAHEQSLSLALRSLDEAEAEKHKSTGVVENLRAELRQAEENLAKMQADVDARREALLKLQDAPYMTEKETEALKKMEELLEETRQNLIDFDIFS